MQFPDSPNLKAVYPRWRGEHENALGDPDFVHGLSPLARGTLSPVLFRLSAARFIPAGAGNTGANITERGQQAVYPRWRGEHSKSTQLNLNTFLAHKKTTNFS